jgi:hypothetical protein
VIPHFPVERIITVVSVNKDPDCCQGFHHGDELRVSAQDRFCEVLPQQDSSLPSCPLPKANLETLSHNPCLSTSLPEKHVESDLLE